LSEQGLRPLVLDTNVAVKWHLNEAWSEEASEVLASVGDTVSELLAPGTIQLEFFNTLWKRQRRGGITPEEVRRGWEDFVAGGPITLYAPEDLMPRAAEIVLETGVIVYDALFLVWPRLRTRSWSLQTKNCSGPSRTRFSPTSLTLCQTFRALPVSLRPLPR